jgi:predicted alpha/beta hydrolase
MNQGQSVEERRIPVEIPDGTSNTVTLYRPQGRAKNTFIIFPALGVAAQYYSGFARALAEQGHNAVTADLRGHGHSSVRASRKTNYGYHEMAEMDYPAVVNKVRDELPGSRIILLGHSMGGQLAVLYASLYPETVTALVLMATCSVHYKGYDFPHDWKTLLGTQLVALVARVAGYFPGDRLGFGDRQGKNQILDWARNGCNGRYNVTNSDRDFDALISRLTLPVMALSIRGDNLCQERAVQNLCDKMKNARVLHLTKTMDELEIPNRPHFKWVKPPFRAVEIIDSWIAENF